MALYEVFRTDDVQPGEFVSAVVIASGTAQARNAVSHMAGVVVKGRRTNVEAMARETRNTVEVLSSYFDERDALTQPDATGTESVYTLPATQPDDGLGAPVYFG